MRFLPAAILIYLCSLSSSFAAGVLTDNIVYKSQLLGYAMQYRVYTPENMTTDQIYPTIYMTDGPGYIEQGRIVAVLDRMIEQRQIKPVIAVFVDHRDPDNLRINRRNDELLCNLNYMDFFVSELITEVEENYPAQNDRAGRVIQGLSFGGLNAACFGLSASDYFYGLSMHSPANTRYMRIVTDEYAKYDRLPLKIFMSVGNENDNRRAVRDFKTLLEEKGYDLKFIQNNKDHEWANWRPLIDDALLTFFAK